MMILKSIQKTLL